MATPIHTSSKLVSTSQKAVLWEGLNSVRKRKIGTVSTYVLETASPGIGTTVGVDGAGTRMCHNERKSVSGG